MFWPFHKKRRTKDESNQPLSEKVRPMQPVAELPRVPTSAPPVPRRSSKRGDRKRRASQQNEKTNEAQYIESRKRQGVVAEKENVAPTARPGSIEDITALPISHTLESSPHLRPADMERPYIPYNFRHRALSQTSIQRDEARADRPSRPQTLRSKRSTRDSVTPQRRRSSRKPQAEKIREEEIRAMSAPIPIPKRPGEGPLRRDSKKIRGLGMKDSNVSLPVEESIHSSMSGIIEQRGWEVGSLDVFNPRPAVRLSGTPQYIAPGSVPSTSYMPRDDSKKDKEKAPVTRDSTRKRQTVGQTADDFDASDLRTLLERDAKRRDRRKKEQQEKLDTKLRSKAGRERGDSGSRRREAEEARRADELRRGEEARRGVEARGAEEAAQRAEEEKRARELMTPPTDVHPAFRDQTAEEGAVAVGLGIGENAAQAAPIDPADQHDRAIPTTTERGIDNTGTYFNYPPKGAIPENPFTDPVSEPAKQTESEREREKMPSMPGAFTPIETPMEDPAVRTAQAVRMSQASTPPLSPINTGRAPIEATQSERELSPPPLIVAERRTSEPKQERRVGGWASIFRRGGTTSRTDADEGRETPSELSFSNTSRESMRNQPLPAHLVDTGSLPQQRRKSGTPVRTQSKFREDLPEIPLSPPDSRTQSPDVMTAAAAAASARRARRSPQPVDIPGAVKQTRDSDPDPMSTIGRNDTPVSRVRGHGLMSASLASVDSEGSWLASGSNKRQSGQSALSRGMGSLNRKRFSGSYEELGGDQDAEYLQRMTPSPGPGLHNRKLSSPALAGASPDEESEDGEAAPAETSGDPLTVHESMRRKPTLVLRDPHVKSREGLLAEYATAEPGEDSPARDESDMDELSQVQSATSVSYKTHARHISAGSAKILDIPSKRASVDAGGPTSAPPPPLPQSPTTSKPS